MVTVAMVTITLQVTPLTALKFAELTVKAGIPKGVVNIVPGSGKRRGEAVGPADQECPSTPG